MADKWPLMNGNWSDPTIWNDGVVPGPMDRVSLNNKVITVDVSNIDVSVLTNNNIGGGSGGGYLVVSQPLTITADIQFVDTYSAYLITFNPGNYDVTMNGKTASGMTGNVPGGYGGYSFRWMSSGTLTINTNVNLSKGCCGGFTFSCEAGTIVCNSSIRGYNEGTLYIAPNVTCIFNGQIADVMGIKSSGNLIVNSDLTGNFGDYPACPITIVGGSCVVYGNIKTTRTSDGGGCIYIDGGTLTMHGNVLAGSNGIGIRVRGSPIVNINGNLYGGNALVVESATANVTVNPPLGYVGPNDNSNYSTIRILNGGKVTINGNVYAGYTRATIDVNNGRVYINGNLLWDSSNVNMSYAVQTTNNGLCILNGDVTNHYGDQGTYGQMAVGGRLLIRDVVNRKTAYVQIDALDNPTGNPVYHYGSGLAGFNHAAPSNVRQGIVYGPANEYIGTCAVPPPQAVAYGVPVDNTVGQAAITAQDIENAVWNALIENGIPAKKALRAIAAALAGVLSGAGTGSIQIKGIGNDVVRITANVDNKGNRQSITLSLD